MSSSDSDHEDLSAIMAVRNPIARINNLDAQDSDSDSDENTEFTFRIPRAPRRYLPRDRLGSGQRLYQDYFAEHPTFPLDYFRRRFRMSRPLFIRICQGILSYPHMPLPSYFDYFRQRRDATGLPGFNVFQKVTSALRQLAYGCAADAFDEYLHMGQQTSYDCLDNFCKCIFHLYSNEYLRRPTLHDVQRLHQRHAELHGFPGMLGSIDCMHWAWQNCPIAWQGQYTRGDHGYPTIMLEAVASYDLWIWHAFFGPAGSSNDLNVLNESDLFQDLLQDRAPEVVFNIAGQQFNKGYYLGDGIYPEWATIVKSFKHQISEAETRFKRYQESARKDVERAFGVLQGRWGIIKNPARPYSVNKIRRIMYCCVILHNMITEDNGRNMCPLEEDYTANPENMPQRSWEERVETHLRMDKELRDRAVHHRLREALIAHISTLPPNFRTR
jgi:hypothetical protein